MTSQEHALVTTQIDAAWPVSSLVTHGERTPYAEPIFNAYLDTMLDNAPAAAPIVEIGAGIGYLGSTVPDRFRQRYIQTEIGEENSREALRQNPDMATITARAQELPFKSGTVGAIIARNLFDMVDTPAVISEIERVLQPGGLAMHMRDHAPCLAWVHEQIDIGKTKRLIPHFTPEGDFQRYQVISQSALNRFLADYPNVTAEDLSNPEYQEYMRVRARDELHLISRLASAKSERVTPLFSEIMDKKLAGWFRRSGLDTDFETFSSGYELPMDYAVEKLGWPKDANCHQRYSDGYWWRGNDEAVSPNMVQIVHSFDVVAAIKKRA
jgi:SAM-dependent methyltransferase